MSNEFIEINTATLINIKEIVAIQPQGDYVEICTTTMTSGYMTCESKKFKIPCEKDKCTEIYNSLKKTMKVSKIS